MQRVVTVLLAIFCVTLAVTTFVTHSKDNYDYEYYYASVRMRMRVDHGKR